MRLRAALAGLAFASATLTPASAQEGYTDTDVLHALATLSLPGAALAEHGVFRETLGDIALPSGRIVAVDPLTAAQIVPLALSTPPGRYAVELVRPLHEDRSTAVAALRFNACTPTHWQPAALAGRSLASLQPGEAWYYGVDTGMGSFADLSFYESFGKGHDGRPPGPSYERYGQRLLGLIFPGTSGVPEDVLDSRDGAGLVTFTAGYGDGGYASYWGFSAEGCPCLLATDFAILQKGAAYSYRKKGPMGPPTPIGGLTLDRDPTRTGTFAACQGTS